MSYDRTPEEERELVAQFAKNNPFPSRLDILELTQKRKDEFGMYMFTVLLGLQKPKAVTHFQDGSVNLDAFDSGNYDDLKAIYDSGMDKDVARERGQNIVNRGEQREIGYGIEELRGMYRIMQYYSPFAKAHDPVVYALGTTMLNHLWDGIRSSTEVWES